MLNEKGAVDQDGGCQKKFCRAENAAYTMLDSRKLNNSRIQTPNDKKDYKRDVVEKLFHWAAEFLALNEDDDVKAFRERFPQSAAYRVELPFEE